MNQQSTHKGYFEEYNGFVIRMLHSAHALRSFSFAVFIILYAASTGDCSR